jgi:hypothetical protein
MNRKLLIVAIALVILTVVIAPVAAGPAIKRLPSPSPLSPANNAKFPIPMSHEDLQVMLEWSPVVDPRVSGYLVDVEYYSPIWDLWGRCTSLPMTTTDTYYQADVSNPCCSPLMGGYTFRWRVTALSSQPGSDSTPSNWQTFSFPDPTPTGVRLAAIDLVSPANKAKFSAGDPQSYEWKLVPGGDEYVLIHEKMNAYNQWASQGGNPTVVFGSDPVFPYTNDHSAFAINPGTYRWRVYTFIAYGDLSGVWSKSPWRTYTVA